MSVDFLSLANAIKPQLDEIRQTLHRHPETGRKEFFTTDFLEQKLQSMGLSTYRIAETGVVGVLNGTRALQNGTPVHTVGLRADIDALPVTEATGCSFASEFPGTMHACGHDVHMTSALGAAMLLSSHTDWFAGEIRFFFQPDEEGYGGAKEMVDKGVTEGVEAVFGAHVDPNLPLGTIGVKYGHFYAASDMYDIHVHGVSSHGAQPEKGKNALVTAAEIAVRLTALTDYDPDHRRVVTVGDFHSGSVRNIISAEATLEGIIRTLGKEVRQETLQQLKDICNEVTEKYGTTCDIVIRTSYSGITNTDPETTFVEETLKNELGEDHLAVIQDPVMISEDFGEFVDATSGSFYHLGAGCPLPLHNDRFLPDDMAYVYGAAAHTAVLLNYLNRA